MAIEKSENLIKKAFDNAYYVPDIKNKLLIARLKTNA